MKAIVHHKFGSPDVLSLEEVEKPVPDADGVLVRVRAASVNPLDWHMVRGTPRIIRLTPDVRRFRPMRPGRDVAGEVETVGSNVRRFRAGDAVFGACQGAFAEYVCGREKDFVAKPHEVSFEDSAAIPIAGLTALQALRDNGQLRAGQSVLIIGASGGVGTFAVQLAKLEGAAVTAVCSADAAELVRTLGAVRVIDYRSEDFSAAEPTYDLIVDCIGNRAYRTLRRILKPAGRIVAVGGGGPGGRALGRWLLRALGAQLSSRFAAHKVSICMSKLDLDDLAGLGARVAKGELSPVIDRRYPLNEGAEALRYVAEGHARGKVVIDVAD